VRLRRAAQLLLSRPATDGLEQYDTIAEALGLAHFGCLQHCRTYFHKAAKVTELPSGQNLARVALKDHLGAIYGVEREIKAREARVQLGETLPLERVLPIRQQKSAPLLATFKDWVDQLLPGVASKSAVGKALSYTAKQWPKLVRHLEHPEMPVDNNYVENQIRPVSQGRRAWLFAETQYGAQSSPNLYSLVSSARANGLEPSEYLRHRNLARPRHRAAAALGQQIRHAHLVVVGDGLLDICSRSCPRPTPPRPSRRCSLGMSNLC
jgi:transposase